MKKTTLLAVCVAMMLFVSQAAMAGGTEDESDSLEGKLNQIQESINAVHGDTTEIKGIIGHVFEGTVPKGGSFIALCNQNGWSLIVAMGHNNLANPSEVAAGTAFTYPQTQAEFKAALAKGKALHKDWLSKQSTTFRVNRIKVDTVEIDKLKVRVVHVTEQLKIKDMEIDTLRIRLADVTEKLRIKELEIGKVTIDKLHIKQLEIDNLKDLCTQLRARCAQLEARAPQTVVREVVYKSLDGAGYAPPQSMRLIQGGDSCDERPFSGMVTDGALQSTNGKSVDVLELHRRAGKDAEFKVKRLHVDSSTGVAIPMVWSDGSCVRKYSDRPITESDMRTLMSTRESLTPIDVTDVGKKRFGQHMTEGVYVIYSK